MIGEENAALTTTIFSDHGKLRPRARGPLRHRAARAPSRPAWSSATRRVPCPERSGPSGAPSCSSPGWSRALVASGTGKERLDATGGPPCPSPRPTPPPARPLRTFEALTGEELEARLAKAAATFATYRRTPMSQRAQWLTAAADILEAEADEIGAVMTTEMGKTLAAAKAEVAQVREGLPLLRRRTPRRSSPTSPSTTPAVVSASRAYTRWQPLGPVLAVMPWNFPLWQVDALRRARADGGQRGAAQARLQRPADRAQARRSVAARRLPRGRVPDAAGRLRRGREDPRRLPGRRRDPHRQRGRRPGRGRDRRPGDQDDGPRARRQRPVRRAALRRPRPGPRTVATTARCQNNGQSCIAAKRFIVHADCAQEFEQLFAERMSVAGRR